MIKSRVGVIPSRFTQGVYLPTVTRLITLIYCVPILTTFDSILGETAQDGSNCSRYTRFSLSISRESKPERLVPVNGR